MSIGTGIAIAGGMTGVGLMVLGSYIKDAADLIRHGMNGR